MRKQGSEGAGALQQERSKLWLRVTEIVSKCAKPPGPPSLSLHHAKLHTRPLMLSDSIMAREARG
jgi:hypothetical protein